MKWWSLRHSQWTKISYLLYLPFAQKKIKKISDLLYCVEKAKNQRSPKISRFVMVCLLQLRLIFCCSCVLLVCISWGLFFAALASCTAHIHEREREREYWRKRWKAKSEMGTIVVCCTKTCGRDFKYVVVGNLGICRIKNVWRGKNIKWAMILLLTMHFLLFERLKNN